MKIARLTGLVTIALMALMGLATASPALANQTTLCKSNSQIYCPSSERYPSGTKLIAESAEARFELAAGTFQCSSVIEGTTTATSGAPLTGEVTKWTMEKCKYAGHECLSPETTHLPASASIERTTEPNGTMTLQGKEGEIGWFLKCTGVGCIVSFNPTFTFHGDAVNATLSDNQSMKFEAFCNAGSSVIFNAVYKVISPKPVYVKATEYLEGNVLCSAAENPCTGVGHIYPANTKFEASLAPGTEAKFEGSTFTISCAKSSIVGETTAESGLNGLSASISSFEFSSCVGSPLFGLCTMSEQKLPYSTTFEVNEQSMKKMNVSGFNQRLSCYTYECIVTSGKLEMAFSGGAPAAVEGNQRVLTEKCFGGFAEPMFRAKYQFSTPKPLYLVKN